MSKTSRELDRVGVKAGGVEAIAVVAAAIENDQRNVAACREIQDQAVASTQVGIAQSHLAKSIIFVRIAARNPKGKIGCE